MDYKELERRSRAIGLDPDDLTASALGFATESQRKRVEKARSLHPAEVEQLLAEEEAGYQDNEWRLDAAMNYAISLNSRQGSSVPAILKEKTFFLHHLRLPASLEASSRSVALIPSQGSFFDGRDCGLLLPEGWDGWGLEVRGDSALSFTLTLPKPMPGLKFEVWVDTGVDQEAAVLTPEPDQQNRLVIGRELKVQRFDHRLPQISPPFELSASTPGEFKKLCQGMDFMALVAVLPAQD